MASDEHVALDGKIYASEAAGLINDSDDQIADFRGIPVLHWDVEVVDWYGQSRIRKGATVIRTNPRLVIPEVAFKPETLALLTDIEINRMAAQKRVTAIANAAEESTLTTNPDTTGIFQDNEQILVTEPCGWKFAGYVDGAPPSTTTVKIDDGAGALIGNILQIGIHASLDYTDPQYFTRADNALLDIGNAEDYSLLIRFERTRENQTEVLMAKTSDYYGTMGDTTAGWVLYIDVEGKLTFAVNDGVDAYVLKGKTTIAKDAVHFVVVTFDESAAANCKIYLEGYDDTDSRTGTLASIGDCSNGVVFSIGAESDGGAPFDGKIIEAAVWSDTVLTAANALAYASAPKVEPGTPTAWWPCYDLAAATVIDDPASAANELDLTLVGGTTTNYGTHSRTREATISANLLEPGFHVKNKGIGGWTAGDAASNIQKTSQYIKNRSRSLRIANTDASQAYARLTLTTIANADYHFHAWFRTPQTPNGASQLVNVDAAAALGITVTQAGATTEHIWYEIQFDFEAADTSTTIDLGSGSVTDAEFGCWECVQITKNYVDTGGFETDIAGSDWEKVGVPTVDDTDTAEDTGALCYEINSDTPASKYVKQDVTITSGESYTFTARIKSGTAEKAIVVLSGAASVTLDNGSDTTNWVTVRHEFTAATGTLTIKIYGDGVPAWFDNFSVVKFTEKVYCFSDSLDLVDLEFISQYTDSDAKTNQIYCDSTVILLDDIHFTNQDYVVEDLEVWLMTSFAHFVENGA